MDDLGSLVQLQPGVLLPPEGDFDGCIHVSNQIQKDEDLSGRIFLVESLDHTGPLNHPQSAGEPLPTGDS
jgi:hypothetical protein